MNLYGFADGDPVNGSDPFGTCPVVLAALGPIGAGVAAVSCLAELALLASAAVSANALASDRSWPGELVPTAGGRRQGENAEVQGQGDSHGCMTCGAASPGTPSGEWIKNHVPPTSVRLPGEPQQLGPHCQTCSATQGGWLRGQLQKLKEMLTPKEKPKQVEPESGTKA